MSAPTPPAFETHFVENQSPEFAPRDLWADDLVLREAVSREGGDAFADRLAAYGAIAGGELYALSFDAHRDRPRLRTHDRFGRRVDQVEFHPSYHALMQAALAERLHGAPWSEGPGGHVERAAAFMLFTETEPSVLCPVSMSYAVTPALRANPGVMADWGARIADPRYDPRFVPVAQKTAVTLGMGMTEKQGGSDVRANTTRAVEAEDGTWRITGHKWFTSAPMCDLFLILAQVDGAGVSCFLVPRVLPGGDISKSTRKVKAWMLETPVLFPTVNDENLDGLVKKVEAAAKLGASEQTLLAEMGYDPVLEAERRQQEPTNQNNPKQGGDPKNAEQ